MPLEMGRVETFATVGGETASFPGETKETELKRSRVFGLGADGETEIPAGLRGPLLVFVAERRTLRDAAGLAGDFDAAVVLLDRPAELVAPLRVTDEGSAGGCRGVDC